MKKYVLEKLSDRVKGHTVRYALPKARGGGGRRDLSGLLLAEHDKIPKKVKNKICVKFVLSLTRIIC